MQFLRPQLALLTPVLWLAACGGDSARKVEANGAPPIPVSTIVVTAEAWPEEYEAAGTVRARMSAVISSRMTGYVREVRAQVGDRVDAGQVLVMLDAGDMDSLYQCAEAGREEARSAIPEAENGVAAAQANLELARVTFKRMQDLFASKSISNQEFDEAAARLKAAEAAHAMAQSKRVQLTARIAQADQELRTAEIQRGYARLHAPFDGMVTARSVEPGNLATPGAPLMTIERSGAYRLEAPVEESKLGLIRPGSAVTVVIDAVKGTFEAKVGEVVPSVDAASRAYIVKIDLPPVSQLRSGAFGRARFTLGRRHALTVPAAALLERGQLQSVYVADVGAARTRMVTTGLTSAGRVEVLSGLSAGERVIVPVPASLADGARIEVRQ